MVWCVMEKCTIVRVKQGKRGKTNTLGVGWLTGGLFSLTTNLRTESESSKEEKKRDMRRAEQEERLERT